MLKVLTYDNTSITFALGTEGVNCTLKNSRPEAVEVWKQLNQLAGTADNNKRGVMSTG